MSQRRRVRRTNVRPRTVTSRHEGQAKRTLAATHRSRLARFFLELFGWPVASKALPFPQSRRTGPSHLRAEHPDTSPEY